LAEGGHFQVIMMNNQAVRYTCPTALNFTTEEITKFRVK